MNLKSRERVIIAEVAEFRSAAYRFLASVFLGKPQKHVVDMLAQDEVLDEFSTVFSDACVENLREFARRYTGDILPLEIEYTNLFVAPFGQYVTPYESVYRDECEIAGKKTKGLLVGRSTLDVRKIIRLIGAEIEQSYRGLPDHIGLELQVMQYLCDREARAWDQKNRSLASQYLASEKRFLEEHLAIWVPTLARRILERTTSHFYRAMACLTREYIRIEIETLKTLSLECCEDAGTDLSF